MAGGSSDAAAGFSLTNMQSRYRVPPYIKVSIAMSHTQHQKKKLIARISRLKGQLEAVERALDAERPCGDILQLLASIRGALNGLSGEVLDDHLHEHVLHAADEKARAEAVEEISEVLRTYIR